MPICTLPGLGLVSGLRLSALCGVLATALVLSFCASAMAAPEVAAGKALGKALPGLLPHHATYRLQLESTGANSRLADVNGIIDYRITGNACSGYDTRTRQTSESRTDDGRTSQREIVANAWEAGDGNAFRFSSVTRPSGQGGDRKGVSGRVARLENGAVRVTVQEPEARAIVIDTPVLMPTEHVLHILKQAAAGPGTLSSRVYEGGNDPGKFFDTLAIIGRAQGARKKTTGKAVAQMSEPLLVPSARLQLEGRPYYPVSVSYYDPAAPEEGPEYVMSFALYDNGVIGRLRIDYGSFAVVGAMAAFEALGDEVAKGCTSGPDSAL
ncbi:EipB family protein [Xanthobacter sp. TB0139]|uniref:EipB family protein n=1 Tax=Xanthobacter sp. TB0139 TaxID=3459178 RepID=UPI0040398F4B